jgi:hypothetical protein
MVLVLTLLLCRLASLQLNRLVGRSRHWSDVLLACLVLPFLFKQDLCLQLNPFALKMNVKVLLERRFALSLVHLLSDPVLLSPFFRVKLLVGHLA